VCDANAHSLVNTWMFTAPSLYCIALRGLPAAD